MCIRDSSGTAEAPGTFSVTISAEDAIGDVVTSNAFNIVVSAPLNQPPTFSGLIASQTVIVGTAIQPVSGTFSDPESDVLTFSASGLPAGVTINTGTGEISGTPTAVGSSTVTITATDTDGESVSSNEFAIIATDVPNAIPVFNGPIQNQTGIVGEAVTPCLLYTSPSPRDATLSRMPSSA